MSTYLIDYENVNKSGLNGVSRLTEKDRVVIFYSAKADKMTFGLHRRLNETKAMIEYKRVDVGGHNALDFQLATYLGFLVSQNPSEEYWIVSNDRGFEYLTGFWRKPLYSVTLTREIAAGSASSLQNRAKNMTASAETDQVQAVNTAGIISSENDDAQESVPFVKEDSRDDVSSKNTDPQSTELHQEPLSSNLTSDEASAPLRKTDFSAKRNVETASSGGKWIADSAAAAEEKQIPDSAAISDKKQKSENPEEISAGSIKKERRKSTSTPEKDSSLRVEKHKPVKKAEEERNRSRRNVSGKETPVTAGRKAVSAAIEAERKEPPHSQKTEADTGRPKARLGFNHALMRLFGVHKNSETRKPAKSIVQDKKEKEGLKNQKAADPPRTSKNPADSKNPDRRSEEKSLSEEVRRLTSDLDISEEDRREITSYIQRCRTKQSLNNELVRRFRSEKAGEIYKAVKPLIQDKKGREEPKRKTAEAQKSSKISSSRSQAEKNLSEEVSRLTSNLGLSAEDQRQIASYVQRYTTKQGVNNALVRRFRSQKAGEIYKMIKPLLKEKKGRNHIKNHQK